MRFLLAGLACLALGVGLTEYNRRHASKTDPTSAEPADPGTPDGKKKPKYPKAVATLLETDVPGTDSPTASPELASSLSVPEGSAAAGFAPIAGGAFSARELRGGFGAAVVNGELDEDVLGAGFGVFDEHVEVATFGEDAGVEQLEFGLLAGAGGAFGP